MLYYNVEISSKMAHLLEENLSIHANILCGDMVDLLNIVKKGYKNRTGVDMPQDVEKMVVDNLATIQLIGWGTSIGEKYIKKHVDDEADALYDMASVLGIQMSHSEEGEELVSPEKMSDSYEFPRVLKVVSNDCNRKNQLRIFRQTI